MKNAILATDLSAAQWEYLEPMLPKAARTGRPRTPLRSVINARLFIVKSGCHWHLLPRNFPPDKTIFHISSQWTSKGILAAIHDRLRVFAREQAGRRSRPKVAILGSQTVRSEGRRPKPATALRKRPMDAGASSPWIRSDICWISGNARRSIGASGRQGIDGEHLGPAPVVPETLGGRGL